MNPIPPINDDQIWRQMLAYLDGTLPCSEVEPLNARLKSDAELRAVFADLLVQQIKLKELAEEDALIADDAASQCESLPQNIVPLHALASEATAGTAQPIHAYEPRRTRIRFGKSPVYSRLAIAASLTLIGVAVWFWLQPAKLARLAAIQGTATIERAHRKFAARAGDVLRDGDRLETAPNSEARFDYLGEATEVSLNAATQLELGLKRGSKQLQLDQGSFEARVAKQKPGKPLRLQTRQAEAIVVGTRFKLLASGTATRLEVFEGAVSILQSFEGPSLLVPAGQGVTVVPGLPVTMRRLAESRGTVLLEQWDGSGGDTNQTYLSQFMFSGVGVKPGSSRARGYLHPPRSGAYSFHIAGSGDTELWLSDSDQPTHAREVWSSSENNAPPVVVTLRSDKRYYVELRSRSTNQPSSFTLSWTPPNEQQRVIYGEYLSPFDPGATDVR